MDVFQVLFWVPAIAAAAFAARRFQVWRRSSTPENRAQLKNTLAFLSVVVVVSGFAWTMAVQPSHTWAKHYQMVSEVP